MTCVGTDATLFCLFNRDDSGLLCSAAVAGESEVLMTELHNGHPEEARARLHADVLAEQ